MEILLFSIGLFILGVWQQEEELYQVRCFYRTKEWRALRRRVLRAYGYNCMRCGITHKGMHIDHIYPRSTHPKLELEFNNMQVLCQVHNLEKSNTDTTDYRGSIRDGTHEAQERPEGSYQQEQAS